MQTEQERLAEIKRIYEEGAATFLRRTSSEVIAKNGGDIETLYEKFISYIPKDSCILDLGCGTGRDGKYFIEHGYSMVGVDICEVFIRHLQETTLGEYTIGDIVNSEEGVYQKRYHAIWANACIVHLNREEAVQVFKNCFNALEEGGYLYISSKYSSDTTGVIVKESKSIPGSIKPYLYYTEKDIINDLKSVGFSILDVSLGHGTYGGDQFIRIFCKK